jgi:acyl carrier protein
MDNLTPEAVLAALQPIFQEALDQPGLTVTRRSSAGNTSNWDSLAHIDLIEISERHFNVKFSLSELQSLKDAGGLVDLIINKSHETGRS